MSMNELLTISLLNEGKMSFLIWRFFLFDFLLTKETRISHFLKETISRDE